MNYLGHAWLSFGDPGLLVGNMTADFMKGSDRLHLPPRVQQGVDLHHAIDRFTDQHPATATAKAFFRPAYRLYAAPIVDIIYDHFLANDPSEFTDTSLLDFTQTVYNQLEAEAHLLPPRFAAAFPHMRQHNWLYNYKERWGAGRSIDGLARRASQMPGSAAALEILDRHYDALRDCWLAISPAVKTFAKNNLQGFLR